MMQNSEIKGLQMNTNTRIALLIDCDNVSSSSIEGVLEELAKYGTVNVRHAHGDWKNTKSPCCVHGSRTVKPSVLP